MQINWCRILNYYKETSPYNHVKIKIGNSFIRGKRNFVFGKFAAKVGRYVE